MKSKTSKSAAIIPSTAIAYFRVSSQEQVSNFSLENQEKVCRGYAEKNKITILETFREEGESAKTSDRTELTALLSYAEKHKGKIGYLIVARIDRLNRNILDFYILKDRLAKLNISILSATENISKEAEGVLLEALLAGVAQFDNITRSRKTIEGMKARMAAGYWPSVAPVGYLNGVDADGKRNLIPDPKKALFIRLLFEEYAVGNVSFVDLAEKYKDKFWSRKVPMYKQRVAQILSNPVYSGRVVCEAWSISVRGKFPALVSEELFAKVQDVIGGNAASRKLPRTRFNDLFPLRGIVCGACGHRMTGGSNTGHMKNKKYHYYSCGNRFCPSRRAIPKDDLEDEFSAFLKENEPTPDFIDNLREAVKLNYGSEVAFIVQQNEEARRRIERLKKERENAMELMIKEPSLVDSLKEQITKRDEEIRQAEISLKAVEDEFDAEKALDFAIEIIQTLHEGWKNLGAQDLSVLKRILFPRNVEYHYPNIQTSELSPIYLLNKQFQLEKKHKGCLTGIGPVLPLPQSGALPLS